MATHCHALLLEVQKARAAAREVHGRIARQPVVANAAGCGLADALETASAGVLVRWGLLISGSCNGTPLAAPEHRRDLFELILAGLHAGQPPAAELLVFCHRVLPLNNHDPQLLENTRKAVFEFTEASQPAVQAAVAGSATSESEVEAALGAVLHAVNAALQAAWQKHAELRRGDAASVRAFTFEAAADLCHTYAVLVQTLDMAKQLMPRVPEPPASPTGFDSYAEALLLTASKLQSSAERLALLVDGVPPAEVSAETLNEVRLALATVLRAKLGLLRERWIDAVEQTVPGFRAHPVDPELNAKLAHALIDRLSHQDNNSLYKACRIVYEARKQSLTLDAMTHAMKLFHPTAMKVLLETTHGAIDPDLVREQLLLMRTNEGLVSRMIEAVVLDACKIMGEEYLWLRARHEDPRPPDSLYDGDVLRLLGASIGEKYRIDAYINHGGFSHGFRGTRLSDGEEVFIKTFKTVEERPRERDRIAMIVDLENNHRISREPRLQQHNNIVKIYGVLCGVTVTLPVTGESYPNFHAVVTEYCDGGELYNYIGADDLPPFSEDEAHFLFKQIVELLKVLYMDDEPYYHGDIKEDNLVLSFPGAVLKLIDYGSLRKVNLLSPTEKSTLQHNTADTHGHPFLEGVPLDQRPEAIDVWGAGVCLFRMLTKMNYSPEWAADLPAGLSGNAHDLLEALLRPEGIGLAELARHPWVQRRCPLSTSDMEERLRKRFKGIRSQPRGEMWFNLGRADRQAAIAEMLRIVTNACDAPPMHRFRCTREGEHIKVACHHTLNWQPITLAMDITEGEVLGEYICSVAPSSEACEVVRAGDPVDRTSLRMKLKWLSGSEWRQFNEFAQRIKDVLCNKIVPRSDIAGYSPNTSSRRRAHLSISPPSPSVAFLPRH